MSIELLFLKAERRKIKGYPVGRIEINFISPWFGKPAVWEFINIRGDRRAVVYVPVEIMESCKINQYVRREWRRQFS